jgi:hypothetical protein
MMLIHENDPDTMVLEGQTWRLAPSPYVDLTQLPITCRLLDQFEGNVKNPMASLSESMNEYVLEKMMFLKLNAPFMTEIMLQKSFARARERKKEKRKRDKYRKEMERVEIERWERLKKERENEKERKDMEKETEEMKGH